MNSMAKFSAERFRQPIYSWLLLLFLSIGSSFIEGNRESYIAPIESVDIAIRSFDKPKVEYCYAVSKSSIFHGWVKQTNANWISQFSRYYTQLVNSLVKIQTTVSEYAISNLHIRLMNIQPRNFSESFPDFIS